MKSTSMTLICGVVSALAVSSASAQTWQNPTGGDWADPANWDTSVPGVGGFAQITADGTDLTLTNIPTPFDPDLWASGLNGGRVILDGDLDPAGPNAGLLFENGSTFTGDLTLSDAQAVEFIGEQVTLEDRQFNLAGGSLVYTPSASVDPNDQLVIGPNTVADITGPFRLNDIAQPHLDRTVLQGSVNVNAPGHTVELYGQNQGTITVDDAGEFWYGGANRGVIDINDPDVRLTVLDSLPGLDSNGTFRVANPEIEIVKYTIGSNGFDAFEVDGGGVPDIYVTDSLDLGGRTVALNDSTARLTLLGGLPGGFGSPENIRIVTLSNGTLLMDETTNIRANGDWRTAPYDFAPDLYGRYDSVWFRGVHFVGDMRFGGTTNGWYFRPLMLAFDGSTFTGNVSPVSGTLRISLAQSAVQDDVVFTDVSLSTYSYAYLDATTAPAPMAGNTTTLGPNSVFTVTPGKTAQLDAFFDGQIILQGQVIVPEGGVVEMLAETPDGSFFDNRTEPGAYSLIENQGLIEVAGELRLSEIDDEAVITQTAGAIHLDGGSITEGDRIAQPTLQLAGGQLTGNGSVAVPVVSDAVISPGNSIGQLDFTEDLTLLANSILEIEIGPGGASDLITVAGTLTLDGLLSITPLDGFDPTTEPDATYTIATAGTLLGSFANGPLVTADGLYFFDLAADNGQINLSNFTIIPEPASLALLGLGGLAMLRRRGCG